MVGTQDFVVEVVSGDEQTAQHALSITVNQDQVPTVGLVAHYTFDGNADDTTGNGNDGTVIGGATLIADRFGTANSAYEFLDTSEYVEVDDSPDLRFGTGDFSISAWIYFDGTAHLGSFVSKASGTQFQQISIRVAGGDPYTTTSPGKSAWPTVIVVTGI